MRTRPTPARLAAVAVLGFLLATNPVVSDAAAKITGAQIKDGTVTTADIKDRSLLARDFKAGQLPSGAQGPAGPVGPLGPQGPAGPQGEDGSVGPAGPTGPQGEIGAAGPQGPGGPTGVQGPQGAQGPQGVAGPQGVLRVNTFNGVINSPNLGPTTYQFLGPTVQVPVTSVDQVLVASATVPLAAPSGTPEIDLGMCTKTDAGNPTNFNTFVTVNLDTTRRGHVVSASVRRPAGTYTVGPCARGANGSTVQTINNDYTSGWVMLVNAPASGGSSRPAAGRR